MFVPMLLLCILLAVGCLISKFYTLGIIRRLEEELTGLLEEDRRVLRQLRQTRATLQSKEVSRDRVSQECEELRTKLFSTQNQIRALMELVQKRKEQGGV